MRLFFYSPSHFEPWDYRNPDVKGIGGSEVSHIEMARRLAARGHDVTSYSPLPADCPDREHGGVHWRDLAEADFSQPGTWLLYRCPEAVDKFDLLRTDQRRWLICQDEDYPAWMPHLSGETLASNRQDGIHRVVALCKAQAEQYRTRYPRLRDRVCVSSNGIKGELVDSVLASADPRARNPKRILYASSPDRGLRPLLWIFERAREAVPDLELHVAYGFDNIDKIAAKIAAQPEKEQAVGDARWLKELNQLKEQLKAPGITVTGRLPQPELYKLWATCGLWVCCTRFRETSPVHGDTLVHTQRGHIQIRDLVGLNIGVWSVNEYGSPIISCATDIRCTRMNAEVVKLTIEGDDGCRRELTLTPDHEVLLAAWGRSPIIDPRKYLAAGECAPGTRVFLRHENAPQCLSATTTPFVSGVVIANELAGFSDVFCMQVLPARNFIANGIVVHNCITSMESQALGAVPLFLPIWAVGENCRHGTAIHDVLPCTPGTSQIPVNEATVVCRFAHQLAQWAQDPVAQERERGPMMKWAREFFHWDRWVTQWEQWLQAEANA